MKDSDSERFQKLMVGAMMNYGRQCSDELTAIWWGQLVQYDFKSVEAAVLAHLQDPGNGQFPMTLAHIIGRIPGAGNSLYPTPEEAWNACPKTEDETAWMFPAMVTAYAACRWSLVEGDLIGGRKCFLEVYEREIADKRGSPAWYISDGVSHTQAEREQNRMMLLELHPERAGAGQIEFQHIQTDIAVDGPGLAAAGLLRLVADGGNANRKIGQDEVRKAVLDGAKIDAPRIRRQEDELQAKLAQQRRLTALKLACK